MNQNDIFQILVTGMAVFVIVLQYRRVRELEKAYSKLMLEWQSWAAAKIEDYPTARLLAGIARQNPSAGANNVSVEVPKKPKQGFTLKQSAE